MKQWFEQRKETWIPEKTGNDTYREDSGELRMPFFEKDPDWSKFHSYHFEDGRKVYEIPLKNAEVFLPSDVMNSLNAEEHGTSIIQNILFVESPSVNGTFYMPLIARYYPSAEQDIKDFQEIYYNKIPADWSGTLDIWTYDERFFVGFGIEDGQILTTRHPDIASSLENSSKKDPSINHLVSCQRYRITIVIHNIVCASANNCHVTQGETEYRYVTECTVSSGAGPSLGGIDPINSYPGSGGGGAIGTIGDSGNIEITIPPIPAIDFEVDMRTLSLCHKEIVNKLIGSTQGEFKRIFNKFAKNNPNPPTMKVRLRYGNCLGGSTACVDKNIVNGYATMTINNEVNKNATDLSIARTILHEMLHVYLLFEEQNPTDCDLACLLPRYISKYGSDYNPIHHKLFVETKFLNDISTELRNFASASNYNISALGDEFFKDMAWGGLDKTDVFKTLPLIDRNRIEDRINSELKNANEIRPARKPNGELTNIITTPKGLKACD